ESPKTAVKPRGATDEDGLRKLSLVAIHGQGGHWRASWTSEAMNIFWLHDFLPNIVPNSRILSYGYGASKSSITAVEDLLCGLELLRRDSHALARSYRSNDRSDIMQIASLTYGILFFGVPQHVHNSLNNLALAPTEQDTKNESPEMQALKRDFEGLRDMNV
ncbi:hypothetical protein DH86_00004405, partial [Scytalidium sp. 3C]